MSTIVIFGARGYIGSYFTKQYPTAVTPMFDMGNRAELVQFLDETKPSIIINAAGRTGRPNVDWCESHQAETLYGNVTAPLVLLDECMKRNIYLVQISTGCIYAGGFDCEGFTEDDTPNFSGSFYSRTKKWLEEIMREFPVFLPRLRIPFDGTTSERNVITKLQAYSKVLDQPNSMTYVPDFISTIDTLITKKYTGALNIVNPGVLSPHYIMERFQAVVNPSHTFGIINAADLEQETVAKRSNCKLSTARLESLGIVLPTAAERLEEALLRIKNLEVRS